MRRMRTTIDIPDELFRRAKSEAALRGRKLKDLVEEGLRAVVDKPPAEEKSPDISADPNRTTGPPPPDFLKKWCALSTNKKYYDDLGSGGRGSCWPPGLSSFICGSVTAITTGPLKRSRPSTRRLSPANRF